MRDLNYLIIEAKDSASAMRLVDADKKFDLLLTDVVLPGKNGRELATEIEQRRPGLKVIFMTGYSRNAIVPSWPARSRHRIDHQAADRGRAGALDPSGARRAGTQARARRP
ncbi:MAG: response regulator [Pseudolabrys sp.]